jgi:imidazolonepropionase-like amidohydrolase
LALGFSLMRRAFAQFLLILLALPCLAAAKTPPHVLVFTNVAVIDVSGGPTLRNMNVVIHDDRIVAISKRAVIHLGRNVEVVNATGKFLIPGLWDMHVHAAVRPEADLSSRNVLSLYLVYGVVGVRDMGGDWTRLSALRKELAAGTLPGPILLAAGPFVDGPQEANPNVIPVASPEEARAAVHRLKSEGVDFVKVQAGLSREAFFAVADEARKAGMVFAGHVPEAVNAVEVSDAGQKSMEHVSPALPGDAGILLACSTREDELRGGLKALRELEANPKASLDEYRARMRKLQADLLDSYDPAKGAAVMKRLVRNQTWVVPTLIWSQSFRPLSKEDTGASLPMNQLPAKLRQRWLGGRQRYLEAVAPETLALNQRVARKSVELVGALHRAGVLLLAGTDSTDAFVVPGFSLHQELELLVAAGLTPLQALQTATMNPSRFLGRAGERGAVEKGRAADLVLLDANPLDDIRNTRRISGVVIGGKYMSRRDLDRIAAGLEKAAEGAGTKP